MTTQPVETDAHLTVQKLGALATTSDLEALGFQMGTVTAKRMNIPHPDRWNRGPFCRLLVKDLAPSAPGVYTWACDGNVMDVGHSGELPQVVHGSEMDRPYNDYTYIPASQVKREHDPRVRINGLLNQCLSDRSIVEWWWLEVDSLEAAKRLEAQLIAAWNPPWNRNQPRIVDLL